MKSWTRTINTMMNVKKPDNSMSLDGIKSQITTNSFAQNIWKRWNFFQYALKLSKWNYFFQRYFIVRKKMNQWKWNLNEKQTNSMLLTKYWIKIQKKCINKNTKKIPKKCVLFLNVLISAGNIRMEEKWWRNVKLE